MVQTKLSMFIKEDTTVYEKKETYVAHEYIKEHLIIAKPFQTNIAKSAIQDNTAIILPTGLGKTIIAFLVIAEILPKKVLFLAPTKPLVMQHFESCKKFLKIDKDKIFMLSGSIPAKKRAKLFDQAVIVVSTPQTIKNELWLDKHADKFIEKRKNKMIRYFENNYGLQIKNVKDHIT